MFEDNSFDPEAAAAVREARAIFSDTKERTYGQQGPESRETETIKRPIEIREDNVTKKLTSIVTAIMDSSSKKYYKWIGKRENRGKPYSSDPAIIDGKKIQYVVTHDDTRQAITCALEEYNVAVAGFIPKASFILLEKDKRKKYLPCWSASLLQATALCRIVGNIFNTDSTLPFLTETDSNIYDFSQTPQAKDATNPFATFYFCTNGGVGKSVEILNSYKSPESENLFPNAPDWQTFASHVGELDIQLLQSEILGPLQQLIEK